MTPEDALGAGSRVWTRWRAEHAGLPDLRGADLLGADLTRANLKHADLRGTYYNETTIWPINFDLIQTGAGRTILSP